MDDNEITGRQVLDRRGRTGVIKWTETKVSNLILTGSLGP